MYTEQRFDYFREKSRFYGSKFRISDIILSIIMSTLNLSVSWIMSLDLKELVIELIDLILILFMIWISSYLKF